MDFTNYLDHCRAQTAAMRAAAVAAGPEAKVPTCPEWTVRDLVSHVAWLQAWVRLALKTAPGAERPDLDRPARDWDDLLAWWDEQAAAAADEMATAGPDAPAWVFAAHFEPTVGWWARRQAHEIAIHRLDAELATGAEVPTLLFPPDFAADGIAEMLSLIAVRRARAEQEGTVLLHAADAGRAWVVNLTPGEQLDVGTAEDAAIDVEAGVVGTADAVYRAMWGRPSTAVVTGDTSLLTVLRAP